MVNISSVSNSMKDNILTIQTAIKELNSINIADLNGLVEINIQINKV